MFNKNELIGEDCYKIENVKIVCYRAFATCTDSFNMRVQSDKHESLPYVKDLNSDTPVNKDGYYGWALDYMTFLKKKKYISTIKYEKREHDFNFNCPIEQKMNLKIDDWYDLKIKHFEKERECHKQENKAKSGTCLIRHDKVSLEAEILYIENNFDYEELKNIRFWELINKNEYFEKGDFFLDWLKEQNYISYYEKINLNKELIT